MKSHLPPKNRLTNRERQAAHELIEKEFASKRQDIVNEIGARAIILCVFVLWREFHFGPKRMQEYLKALDKLSDKAMRDDTWVEETVEALRKIGVEFNIKV